ncbi:hypothetical protein E6O75_ATG06772 [Venturia nashicola]|uniref:Uncharacterized protein n=1 Tax=Venturia nashicola TaxID=86259 RepID=A0A4Z1NU57_9PEZI|nr:hypothetical protein E6O75_ATG06772 [Venturia nashicola]
MSKRKRGDGFRIGMSLADVVEGQRKYKHVETAKIMGKVAIAQLLGCAGFRELPLPLIAKPIPPHWLQQAAKDGQVINNHRHAKIQRSSERVRQWCGLCRLCLNGGMALLKFEGRRLPTSRLEGRCNAQDIFGNWSRRRKLLFLQWRNGGSNWETPSCEQLLDLENPQVWSIFGSMLYDLSSDRRSRGLLWFRVEPAYASVLSIGWSVVALVNAVIKFVSHGAYRGLSYAHGDAAVSVVAGLTTEMQSSYFAKSRRNIDSASKIRICR